VAFVPKGLAGFFITDYSFFFAIGILTYMILKDIAVQFKNWHYLYLAMSIFFAGRAVYLQALGFELAHKNSSWSAVFFFLFFVILFFIGINLHYSKKWFIKLSGVLGGASYILYLIHQFIGYRIAHYFSYWTIYHSFGLLFVMMIVAIILHLFLEKRVAGYIKIVLSKINL
jgi:peptidoglycan/LPS O-acetylase OafA/YrhL